MQTFDQTVTNVDNNPSPIDNYPSQVPIDNTPAPADNFGASFGGVLAAARGRGGRLAEDAAGGDPHLVEDGAVGG